MLRHFWVSTTWLKIQDLKLKHSNNAKTLYLFSVYRGLWLVRTLPSELLVQVVIIYSMKKNQGSPSAESARRGKAKQKGASDRCFVFCINCRRCPQNDQAPEWFVHWKQQHVRWVATVASEGPWAMMRIYARTKAVFRSEFWSAKIHCSILFVFGKNCPNID
jgi:hypothetical protein